MSIIGLLVFAFGALLDKGPDLLFRWFPSLKDQPWVKWGFWIMCLGAVLAALF